MFIQETQHRLATCTQRRNPELTQIHVHQVGDAIQPSHPLSSPSPPALNLSQHQGLFWWVSSSHQVAKVLELQLQHQSFQWTPRTDLLQDGLVGSPCSPRVSQESSPIPQFKSINSSVLSFLYSPTLTPIHDHWKNHSFSSVNYPNIRWLLVAGFFCAGYCTVYRIWGFGLCLVCVVGSGLCPEANGSFRMHFPVLHHFLEFTQTRVHWVSDAI